MIEHLLDLNSWLVEVDVFELPSLKLTASLHLKMDGWNTIVSFWGLAHFQGRTAGFREGIVRWICRLVIGISD